jgi:hypothetical protein
MPFENFMMFDLGSLEPFIVLLSARFYRARFFCFSRPAALSGLSLRFSRLTTLAFVLSRPAVLTFVSLIWLTDYLDFVSGAMAQWLLPASDEFGFFMPGRRGTPFEGSNTVLFGVFGQPVVASWSAWSSGFRTSFHFISIWHSRDFILIWFLCL